MNTYSFEKLVINICYFFGVTRHDRGVHHLTHAVACSNHECSLLIHTMYQLQYWHEQRLEWRGAGYTSDDIDAARRRMRGAAEQCGYCVRFRIYQMP